MSFFSPSSLFHSPLASSTAAIVAPVERAVRRVAQDFQARQAVRAVQRLDDAALHDLGIGRGEIEDRVRHGRSA